MIGLDTNVLVRYITQDDPAQAAKAAALLESLTAAEPGFISLVVTAELAWVLERTYRLGRGPLAAVVERLLQTETLRVQNDTEVFAAMLEMRHGHADFADALIAALARSAGCRHTATFDRRALRLAGVARHLSLGRSRWSLVGGLRRAAAGARSARGASKLPRFAPV
ncbi:MAG TPA: type II toxin-antitoxin system VapC family toxin [Terriglobales bacterium]